MDFEVVEREMQEMRAEKSASPEQLAALLPNWAAEMMLDPEVNEEYEGQASAMRAAELHAGRVDGRLWEEMDADTYNGEGAGMAEFTTEELAEDYNLPLEAVVEALLSIGVDRQRLQLRKPVKAICSSIQLNELLNFLGGADPIALREALSDNTLEDLAETLQVLDASQLLDLCVRNEISAVLGVRTRLPLDDYASLVAEAEREAAFLRKGP